MRGRQIELDLNPTSMEGRPPIRYEAVPVGVSTFKNGLAREVHRWVRLTPSFGPDLVQQMLSTLGVSAKDTVLDPFSGAGTTLIECQLEQIKAVGLEINPFLHFACNASLTWDLDATALSQTLTSVISAFESRRGESRTLVDQSPDFQALYPTIANRERWWRDDVLFELVLLKVIFSEEIADLKVRNFFRACLAGVLVPDLTNVVLNRLQLHFVDRTHDVIDVALTFARHAELMISDISKIFQLSLRRTARVIQADSTQIQVGEVEPVNVIITSPPYPNRYSYVWNTRPHLYFFDFMRTPKEASDLDKRTIGGTWGTATSMHAKGRTAAIHPAVDEIVSPVADQIRLNDNLMANYLMSYFNLMAKHLQSMAKLLTEDGRVAYVVGCSRLKGVFVETDVMLAELMERLEIGLRTTEIHRIRRRHSDHELHESIVYAKR